MHQDVLSAGTLSTRLISSQGHRPSATSAQLSSKLKLWKKLRPKLWRELRGIPTNSQGKEDCCLLPRRILKIKGKKEESEIRMNVRVDNGGDDLILGLPMASTKHIYSPGLPMETIQLLARTTPSLLLFSHLRSRPRCILEVRGNPGG